MIKCIILNGMPIVFQALLSVAERKGGRIKTMASPGANEVEFPY